MAFVKLMSGWGLQERIRIKFKDRVRSISKDYDENLVHSILKFPCSTIACAADEIFDKWAMFRSLYVDV